MAQKSPFKMGEIPNDLLKMTSYDKDPDADAVVVYDFGIAELQIASYGDKMILDRQCRIKIFNNDGFDNATVMVPIYNGNNVHESVNQIKGYTYNLVNGKEEKTKLDKSSIFTEETTKDWNLVKFTMPNVKEGSVIEFSYTVNSDAAGDIPKWRFQEDIPVAWSEYYVKIPEYFNFIQLSTGYENYFKYEKTTEQRNVSLGSESGSINFNVNVSHYIAKDMPALRDEAFVSNPSNFLQSVEFQLASINVPGSIYKDILGTWENINKRFLEDYDNFGPNMHKKSFYKDELEVIMAKYQNPSDRLAAIYNFVADYIKWNKSKDYIPNQSIKKTFDERVGSSADINALLISMLRAADIDADPVLISTRDNGLIHPVYPILSKFNYLIAVAYIDNQKILLDATEKLPVGYLPVRCLNQQGRVISEKHPGWVELEPEKGADYSTMCQMKIGADGNLTGELQRKLTGYAALEVKQKIKDNGEEKYLESVKSKHKSWDISDYKMDESETVTDEVKESFNLSVDHSADMMGDVIYINPVLTDRIDENPFKREERKLPIDFVYPYRKFYMINLSVPENYEIDEIPESVQMSTPDGSAIFKFLVKKSGLFLQLVSQYELKKSIYLPSDYKVLREFYAMVVSKHNAQIVLKKKTGESHETSGE